MLHDGLYEQIINKGLETELSSTDKLSTTAPIDSAEASKVLAKYIAEVVEKGLDNVADNGGDVSSQVALANRIISTIITETKENELGEMTVAERAEQLLALFDKKNSILSLYEKAAIIRPETSIAQSSLFTGAIHEPQMFTELKKEIISCNRIDMLVSFIKWSGLRLIMDELTTFTQNGGELRIITTSYMGATDVKAIEELRKLPNTKIKVSYDTKRTRLHAKTYVFYRDTGFTTAYVGSSNLSNAAISSGLEWNVKVTKKDQPETIDKIEATFESYWNSNEFEYYNEEQKERLARALKAEKYFDSNNAEVYTMDIAPYAYQQEILDKLEAERKVRGYNRNLIIAATGTGKTVISALDYKRFRKQNPDKPCRLLFVAHREEILKQSMYTFRAVLKDANFGEMFVSSYKPESISFSYKRDMHPGDFLVLYRKGSTPGRKGYESVVSTIGVIDEVKYNFKNKEDFLKCCENRTVFTPEELDSFWRTRRDTLLVIKFIFVKSLNSRLNLKHFWDNGLIPQNSGPRPFDTMTDDDFDSILHDSNTEIFVLR